MKNPLRVRFVRDVAMTGSAQLIQAICAMLGGILVARFLGPAAKGQLTVLIALGAMAVLLCSFGVHQSSIYFLGRHKDERTEIVSTNTVFALVGGLLTAAALAAVAIAFQRQLLHGIALSLFFVYLAAVPANYLNEFVRRTLLGTGRVVLYSIPDLVQGVSLLFGTALVILSFGKHVEPLVVLRVATEVGTAVFMLAYLWRVVPFRLKASGQLLRRQLGYGIKNYASSIFWLFLITGDAILVNHFLGNSATGVYSVAVSLGLPVTMLGAVVGTLIFQRVAADESEESRRENTNRVVRVLVVIASSVVIALGLAANWLVPFVYGAEFHGAIDALWLLLPGLLALALESVVMGYLAGNGSPPVVYWGPFLGLVVNIGVNLVLIPRLGINGASISSSIGYSLVLVIALIYYMRLTDSRLGDVLMPRRSDFAALLHSSGGDDGAGRAEAQVA